MSVPFHLDAHPRRPQPLGPPPAGYFEQLPMRVMAGLPQAPEARFGARAWWRLLPVALRTGLASGAVLGGFAAAFWLGAGPAAAPAASPGVALDQVPQTELVRYLLGPEARVETVDLATLSAADPHLTQAFLRPAPAEVQDLLDGQPAEEAAYL